MTNSNGKNGTNTRIWILSAAVAVLFSLNGVFLKLTFEREIKNEEKLNILIQQMAVVQERFKFYDQTIAEMKADRKKSEERINLKAARLEEKINQLRLSSKSVTRGNNLKLNNK